MKYCKIVTFFLFFSLNTMAQDKIIVVTYSNMPQIQEDLLSILRTILVGNFASIHQDRTVLPEKDPLLIERLKGCYEPVCISETVKELDVAYVIIAEVRIQDNSYIVYIIGTDVTNKTYIGTAMVILPQDSSQWVNALVPKVTPLINSIPQLKPKTGSLVIITEPKDPIGEVYINNHKVGNLPLSPIKNLLPGTYTIVISAKGYKQYNKKVTIEAGKETIVEALLQKEVTIPEFPKEKEKTKSIWYKNKWIWVGVGSGILALTAALTLGITLSQKEHETKEWGIPFPNFK